MAAGTSQQITKRMTPGKLILWSTGGVSFLIFALTSFRTFTWWDSVTYSLAAHNLGVPGPPGSLLAVLAGWPVCRLMPSGWEAAGLNLLAALFGALTCGLVARHGFLMWRASVHESRPSPLWLAACGAAIAGLTFAFADTLWQHATKFTPYILTALMTTLIVWQLWRWWQVAENQEGITRLALVALLLGLDFSIHRTNLLLIPGILVFVALRNPRILLKGRLWLYGGIAFAAGLAVHLLQMAIASRHPAMNFGDPSNWSRFWDYISLQQFGGGWLFNLYPRKAPFWSYQVMDYLSVLRHNFCDWSGRGSLLGLLPILMALTGLVSIWRKEWKLGAAILALFLSLSLGAVLYFNIPANFFRPFDRHYLPSFVIFGILMSIGTSAVFGQLSTWTRYRMLPGVAIFVVALAILPGIQVWRNYEARDGSDNFFARDFAGNLLAGLEPNAIIITYGDSDTFPLWYLQEVEGQRSDVTVINVWLLNTPWFVRQVMAEDINFPLKLTDSEIAQIGPRAWPDTVIAVPAAAVSVDTAHFHIAPNIQGKYLLPHDWLIAGLIAANQFRRPIYFSVGGSGVISSWITPHLRLDGLASRLMPDSAPPLDMATLKTNLLERYEYRGWADSSVTVDETSQSMALNYWQAFGQYLLEIKSRDGSAACRSEKQLLEQRLPMARITTFPAGLSQWLRSLD